MTIKDALIQADNIDTKQHMSDDAWALRVLAGAYRREKIISAKLRDELAAAEAGLAEFAAGLAEFAECSRWNP
jgi:ATP-dependent Zn protease